jgi:hypothetical protein
MLPHRKLHIVADRDQKAGVLKIASFLSGGHYPNPDVIHGRIVTAKYFHGL